MARLIWTGPPVPKQRKRRLSIHETTKLSNSSEATKAIRMLSAMSMFGGSNNNNHALKQDQCRLLQLPKDIRDMIYEEVVGRDEVYIIFHRTWNIITSCQERNIPSGETRIGQKVKMGMDIIPVLRTCKMMYTELIVSLYTTPTFTFLGPGDYLAFSASLAPARFQSVRNVYWHFVASGAGIPPRLPGSHYVGNDNSFKTINHSPGWGWLHDRPAYNDCMSDLGDVEVEPKGRMQRTRVWDALCTVLGRMQGLTRLELVIGRFHPVARGLDLLTQSLSGRDKKLKVMLKTIDEGQNCNFERWEWTEAAVWKASEVAPASPDVIQGSQCVPKSTEGTV